MFIKEGSGICKEFNIQESYVLRKNFEEKIWKSG